MKALHSVKWILLAALMMPGLTACSFFGGEDAPAEEVAANGEEAAADPNAEANAESNNTTDPTAENTENATADAGNTEAGLPPPEDPSNANMGLDNTTVPTDLMGGNTMADTGMGNSEPLPAAPENLVPVENAAPAPAPEAAAAAPVAPPSGTRVYFVNVPSLALRDRPDGQTIGELKMGDPVLVSVEGNWANIFNRGYVELASLSMGPVARSKEPHSWN